MAEDDVYVRNSRKCWLTSFQAIPW